LRGEFEDYKKIVNGTLSERLGFIESFSQSIEDFEREMREHKGQ